MFEQKFALSLVVFVHMLQFLFDFYCFFLNFWIGFFLNGFANPFVFHSRPFVEPNFHFPIVVFCSYAAF